MHICIICNNYHREIGGIEKHVRYLSEGLSQAGYKVTVMASDHNLNKNGIKASENDIKAEGVRLVRLRSLLSPMSNPITPLLPFKLLKSDKYDLIHSHDHYYFGTFVSAQLKKIMKKPLICTIHTSAIKYDQAISNIVRTIYDRHLTNNILKLCDRVIALSKGIREYVVDRGVPFSKVRLIPNGIDFSSHAFEVPVKLPMKEENGKIILLYIGRLVQRKGVNILLRAMNMLPDLDRFRLVIVGDGPQRKMLEELSRSLGIKQYVSFLGHISKEELNSTFKSSNMFILPSVSGEVQPFVLLEAIAFKKPFIATKVGGIPDLEKEGIYGYYIQPNDPSAIVDALQDYLDQKERMKDIYEVNQKKGREKFSIEKMIKDTIMVYEEIM